MRDNSAFRRKVFYLCAIAGLLVPISYLSMPDRLDSEGQITGGGMLAQMRRSEGLAQAGLGEIDPAGESMRLAALGFRGVAANILWMAANDYKMKEKWDKLSATLNQITKLQPHFLKVWEFQAWNLSYNVSVEFDDYRQRYHWVKKGIDFIIGGTKYNRDEPKLLAAIGWSTGHKIGRADEKKEYRRLFSNDEDFHRRLDEYVDMENTIGPGGKPDNWLLSHEWYLVAERATLKRPLRGQSPLIFHSRAPMALIDHAVAIEEDGILNEYAQQSWTRSGRAWQQFGNREIPTSGDFSIRLGNQTEREAERDALLHDLERIACITRDEIVKEKGDTLLSDEQKRALEKPLSERVDMEHTLAEQARQITDTTYAEVADRAPAESQGQARLVLARLNTADRDAIFTRRYKSIVNYDYWATRCEVEQRNEAILARKYVYDADVARRKLEFQTARDLYEKAWSEWALIFSEYPQLMNETEGEDIIEAIKRYKKLLTAIDDPQGFPPQDFPLLELVKMHNQKHKLLPPEFDADVGDAASATADEHVPAEVP